jgi:hypothetical protein
MAVMRSLTLKNNTTCITIAKIGSKATQNLTINVNPASVPTITLTNPTTATVGTPYKLTPTVSGGTAPYTWTATGKPSWMSLNASTGVLSGTPTSAATVIVTLQVKDKNGNKSAKDLKIVVNPK